MKVLVLASYCGPEDGTNCTDDLPCLECLQQCNIGSMFGGVSNNLGGWDYNRQLAATGLPRDQAIQKVLDGDIKAINSGRRRSRR